MSMFHKATKKKLKARVALDGPAGSGKTYTGLRFAFALAGDRELGKVAVIDTEHRSASKYVGESPDGFAWDFEVCELAHYAPSTYVQVLQEAGRAGFDVVLIDSLSHAWEGVGGALDQVNKKGGNSFTAWKDVTPQHREMIDAILACPCHVIVTMRTKMEYVLEEQQNKQGKTVQVPKKVGMAPIQRQGMEYEFDVVCDIDVTHTLTVSKTRCPALDGKKAVIPGPGFIAPLVDWLGDGVDSPQKEQIGDDLVSREVDAAGVLLSGQPKSDPQVQYSDDPCGDETAAQIKEAAKELGVPPAKIAEIISRYGVKHLADLPSKAADMLLQKLRVRQQEEEVPF